MTKQKQLTPAEAAAVGAQALAEAGYSVTSHSYEAGLVEDEFGIGARHYVTVTVGQVFYTAQWNDKLPGGSGFNNVSCARGYVVDEDVRAALDGVVGK